MQKVRQAVHTLESQKIGRIVGVMAFKNTAPSDKGYLFLTSSRKIKRSEFH